MVDPAKMGLCGVTIGKFVSAKSIPQDQAIGRSPASVGYISREQLPEGTITEENIVVSDRAALR